MIINSRKGTYGKAIAVFGKTRYVPFGSQGKEQKDELGKILTEVLSNY